MKIYTINILFITTILFVGCKHKHDLRVDHILNIESFSNQSIVQKQVKKVYDGANKSREPDELILYTPAYGEKTHTNEWGGEVVIENNTVISKIGAMGINNSTIPENGFVLSGHGKGADWLSHNIRYGMDVELVGEDRIIVTSDENDLIRYSEALLTLANQRILDEKFDQDRKSELSGIKGAIVNSSEQFTQAKNSKNVQLMEKYSEEILDLSQKFLYSTFPSVEGEFRGAWLRIRDNTPEALRKTIKMMSDVGFNAILPETIYNGYAIYPDAHDNLPQNPQFLGWDPMQVIIEECDKYNIDVIPWTEMFFVGKEDSPIMKNMPRWSGVFRNGLQHAVLEENFCYMCPSNEEVRHFLIEVLETLMTRYDLSALQLDYIRYPLSIPWEHGFCYCDICRNKVKDLHGFDILKISPENTEEWEKWNNYRIQNINSFVREVHEKIRKINPEIKLSADVVPHNEHSKELKFQDWESWVKDEIIDAIYIMSYSYDNRIIDRDCKILMKSTSNSKTTPIVGLGPYMGMEPYVLLEQIEIARENKTKGVCLFALCSMTQEQMKALKMGAFRK